MSYIESQSLGCQVCKQIFSYPVVLPCCGETICKSHIDCISECFSCHSKISRETDFFQSNRVLARLIQNIKKIESNLEEVEFKITSYSDLLDESLNNSLVRLELDIKSNNEIYLEKFKRYLNLNAEKKFNQAKNIGKVYIQKLSENHQTSDLKKKISKWKEFLSNNDWKSERELKKINENISNVSNKINDILTKSISSISIRFDPNNNIDFSSIRIGDFQFLHQIRDLPMIFSSNESYDENNNSILNTQHVNEHLNAILNENKNLKNKFSKTILEDEISNDNNFGSYFKINPTITSFDNIECNNISTTENLESKDQLVKLLGHHLNVKCSMFDHSFKYFITGAEDCLIKIWSIENHLLIATLNEHEKQINCFDINSFNNILASGSSDKNILIWDLETTKKLYSLNGHKKSVECLKFSPQCIKDDRHLVSGGADGSILVWSFNPRTKIFNEKPKKFQESSNIKASITDIQFNKGGSLMGCLVNDNSICIYKMDHLEKIADLDFLYPRINNFKFDDIFNKKIRFFTAYVNNKNKPINSMPLCVELKSESVWKGIEFNNLNYENFDEKKDMSPISLLELNSNSKFLITGQSNYIIKIYELDNLDLVNQIKRSKTNLAVMLPHITLENILLTYGSDKNVIIWDFSDGAQKRFISFENKLFFNTFRWHRSSKTLCFCATNSNGELIIYNDPEEKLEENRNMMNVKSLENTSKNVKNHRRLSNAKLVSSKKVESKGMVKPIQDLILKNTETFLSQSYQQEQMILKSIPEDEKDIIGTNLNEIEPKSKRRKTNDFRTFIDHVRNRFK